MRTNTVMISTILTFLISFSVSAAKFNPAKTFDKKCSACHWIGEKDIGPDLVGVTKRRTKGKKADWKWITSFIQDSQKLIKSGDKRAVAIAKEFKNRVMPKQDLNADEIKKLVLYIEAEGAKLAKKKAKK